MYIANQYALSDDEALALVAQVGVGDLVTCGPEGIEVTYLPFNLVQTSPGVVLHTHMARINPQWHHQGAASVIVHGPSGYISPGHLPIPDPDSRLATVPTWDYVQVLLHGRMIIHQDADWKMATLAELVDHHESVWRMTDAGPEQLAAVLPAMVGVEFRVEKVLGKAKLSQNLPSEAITELAGRIEDHDDNADLAEAMIRLAVPYVQDREARVARAGQIAERRRAQAGDTPGNRDWVQDKGSG